MALAEKGIKQGGSREKLWFTEKLYRSEAEAIREEQLQVVEDYDLFETGKMKSMLQGHFSIRAAEEGSTLTLRHVAYLRFLDIGSVKGKREAYHLYNRIIFGHLYNQILAGLKFGFTDEVRKQVRDEMLDAMKNGYIYHGMGVNK